MTTNSAPTIFATGQADKLVGATVTKVVWQHVGHYGTGPEFDTENEARRAAAEDLIAQRDAGRGTFTHTIDERAMFNYADGSGGIDRIINRATINEADAKRIVAATTGKVLGLAPTTPAVADVAMMTDDVLLDAIKTVPVASHHGVALRTAIYQRGLYLRYTDEVAGVRP